MTNDKQKIKPSLRIDRYYGLRFVSTLYKLLAVLTVLIVLGAMGYLGAQYLGIPYSARVNFPTASDFGVPMLSILIGGGLLALTLYVLSQLIEIQLAMNNKMRQLVDHFQRQETAFSQLEGMNRQMAEIAERLQTAAPLMERKARLLEQSDEVKLREQQ